MSGLILSLLLLIHNYRLIFYTTTTDSNQFHLYFLQLHLLNEQTCFSPKKWSTLQTKKPKQSLDPKAVTLLPQNPLSH
jgi:hypothetical protein